MSHHGLQIHLRLILHQEPSGLADPAYSSVYAIISRLDPALTTLAHEGPARFRNQFELVYRHHASHPNAIWQADHTQLDVLIRDASGEPIRPWLTTVIDDHSRALAGYLVFAGAPSAFQTSLALRQAIWRKADPLWAICSIPDVLFVDHGSDFTSKHLEQVALDLHFELVYSTIARPQGRGKIERLFGTLNTEVLPELPGYLKHGKPTTEPNCLGLNWTELSATSWSASITPEFIARFASHRKPPGRATAGFRACRTVLRIWICC